MDLRSDADVERLLAGAGETPVLIFKHSTSCPVSAAMHTQFQTAAQAGDLDGARLGRVRVIEERPVSLAIAARFGVEHASPQALVIRNGQAVWNASHHHITRQALRTAVGIGAPESASVVKSPVRPSGSARP